MGVTVKGPWVVRGGRTDFRENLCVSRVGNPTIWVKYVDDDPPHGANLEGIPPPREPESHGEAPMTPQGQGLVYLPTVR